MIFQRLLLILCCIPLLQGFLPRSISASHSFTSFVHPSSNWAKIHPTLRRSLPWCASRSDPDADVVPESRRRTKRKPRVTITDDTDTNEDAVTSLGDRLNRNDDAEWPEETTSVPAGVTNAAVPPQASETAVIQVLDVRRLVPGDRTTRDTRVSPNPFVESGSATPADPVGPMTTTTANAEKEDPLAQILQDVQEMRATESRKETTEGNLSISKVLSTIVIADFFVVILLFFWFLLGIFSSYVVHDDAIQIAFNGIFQPVVQPALGLLMIASISDAVLKKEE